MDTDGKIAILALGTVVLAIIFAIVFSTNYNDYVINKEIIAGKDPIAARCAHSSLRDEGCVEYIKKHP